MPGFASWDSFGQFQRELARNRRYVRSRESENFLKAVFSTCKKRVRVIPKNSIYWRAQIGHDWLYEKSIDDEVPTPFSPKRMVPLRDKATEGRVNAKGIPCLYLATTKESAMSEVRPWLGSLISVAQLQIKKDLRIIDCSVFHDKHFLYFLDEPSPREIEKSVWSAIDRAFAEPVTRADEVAEYAATQTIAELFRAKGFDGVVYKSAFGEKGYNVALFDLECAKLINCSLFKASTLNFDFSENANPYFIVKKRRKRTSRQQASSKKQKEVDT